jgi:hypothetical protein
LPEVQVVDADKRRRAVLIVIGCTLIIGAAQYLIKLGANQLAAEQHSVHGGSVSLEAAVMGIFTNPAIFSGYCLSGTASSRFCIRSYR